MHDSGPWTEVGEGSTALEQKTNKHRKYMTLTAMFFLTLQRINALNDFLSEKDCVCIDFFVTVCHYFKHYASTFSHSSYKMSI